MEDKMFHNFCSDDWFIYKTVEAAGTLYGSPVRNLR